jgi:hypothetical protein
VIEGRQEECRRERKPTSEAVAWSLDERRTQEPHFGIGQGWEFAGVGRAIKAGLLISPVAADVARELPRFAEDITPSKGKQLRPRKKLINVDQPDCSTMMSVGVDLRVN